MINPHIETLAVFLTDFANANEDSFEPEHIDYLKQSAIAIEVLDNLVADLTKQRDSLIQERDSARWEVAGELGDGSIDSVKRVAEERGWNLTEYFDHFRWDPYAEFGYDPHTEAYAARAEEGKKRQEEYRARHEERIACIRANSTPNAEGTHNPPF